MLKSFWFVALVAVLLGTATTAGVLLLRWKQVAAGVKAAPEKPGISPRAKNWDFWTNEIEVLSTDLKTERESLDQRAKDLDAVAQRLDAEKGELQKVRADLEALREEITRSIPVMQASEKQNIKALARTYSAMKPAQAVTILGEMDDANVVKLLSAMKPDVTGAIFQEMARSAGPDGSLAARAARLSDQLRLLQNEAAAK